MERCPWCEGNPLYEAYHDKEWGVPVYDDRTFFEFMVLESAQAGLSWITILKKRDAYREAYGGFDPQVVSKWTEDDVERLLANPGIVRNRMKIEASIGNAKAFLEIQEAYGSFASYLWAFVGHKPIVNRWNTMAEIPAESEIAMKIAKDLKKRGCRFLGSKIVYAYMQAMGLVNDHLTTCFRYGE